MKNILFGVILIQAVTIAIIGVSYASLKDEIRTNAAPQYSETCTSAEIKQLSLDIDELKTSNDNIYNNIGYIDKQLSSINQKTIFCH
jgi:hypothetical protein